MNLREIVTKVTMPVVDLFKKDKNPILSDRKDEVKKPIIDDTVKSDKKKGKKPLK